MNLRNLITDRAAGSVGRFAEEMGFESPTILSQVAGKAYSRNIGHSLARRIENAARLPKGWLDHDHSVAPDTAPIPGGRTERAMKVVKLIEQLPDGARELAEQLIDELTVSKPKRRTRKK
jgi:hypothetical protein